MIPILETLGEQAHTRAIPINQLHPISRFARNTSTERERIGLHRLAHQRRQALGSLAEVDLLRCGLSRRLAMMPSSPVAQGLAVRELAVRIVNVLRQTDPMSSAD
jgi:hypothetical protein